MAVFSHSRIDTYLTCPKKYEFCYIAKIPRGPSGIEAFMGSRVHEALEWLYGEIRACRLPDEEDVVDRYRLAWDTEWTDGVQVVRQGRNAEDYRAIGEKAVRGYYGRYHPFDQGVTVGLEMRIALRLDETHEITGFIDRLVKVADGEWEIHDYKTSASLLMQEKADADRQLALYELAVREMFPDARRVVLVWHYLAFDHEVRSCRSPEQLADLRAQVLEEIGHIEAQTEFATRTSKLCDWCDYKRICPAWRHMYEAEATVEAGLPAADGVALVDEYMSVTGEIGVLEARREALREAIVDVANTEGLDRVFGTEHVVSVYRYPAVTLPQAKDPRRAELEHLLEDLGLLDRFESLSTYALSRAIGDGSIDPEALARIEEYVVRSQGAKLYPRKLV